MLYYYNYQPILTRSSVQSACKNQMTIGVGLEAV